MITQTVPATYTFLPVGPISPIAKSSVRAQKFVATFLGHI